MASNYHLVRGAGNPACINGAESTSDDTTGGRERHLTDPIRCRLSDGESSEDESGSDGTVRRRRFGL